MHLSSTGHSPSPLSRFLLLTLYLGPCWQIPIQESAWHCTKPLSIPLPSICGKAPGFPHTATCPSAHLSVIPPASSCYVWSVHWDILLRHLGLSTGLSYCHFGPFFAVTDFSGTKISVPRASQTASLHLAYGLEIWVQSYLWGRGRPKFHLSLPPPSTVGDWPGPSMTNTNHTLCFSLLCGRWVRLQPCMCDLIIMYIHDNWSTSHMQDILLGEGRKGELLLTWDLFCTIYLCALHNFKINSQHPNGRYCH